MSDLAEMINDDPDRCPLTGKPAHDLTESEIGDLFNEVRNQAEQIAEYGAIRERIDALLDEGAKAFDAVTHRTEALKLAIKSGATKHEAVEFATSYAEFMAGNDGPRMQEIVREIGTI